MSYTEADVLTHVEICKNCYTVMDRFSNGKCSCGALVAPFWKITRSEFPTLSQEEIDRRVNEQKTEDEASFARTRQILAEHPSPKCPFCNSTHIWKRTADYRECTDCHRTWHTDGSSEDRPIGIPKCPTCQSTNVQKIAPGSRILSVFTFGLGSDKLGKSYECKQCGYKW